MPELQELLHLNKYALSAVTSAVQIGFIAGTLVFAFFTLADRYSPVRLFFISSVLGGLFNLSIAWFATDGTTLFALRFATGFFLAGIYPVGMKIAADWHEKGLGKALGFLLAALVIGTAFPHLLKNRDFDLPWKTVLYFTSAFAVTGGLLMILFVGDGPFRKRSGGFQASAIPIIFNSRNWRSAAFGYFGHMWELYTFWGFVPPLLMLYVSKNQVDLNIPLLSFLVIGIGGISCIVGGYLSQAWGSAKVGALSLWISGTCCILSPFIFNAPVEIFLFVVFLWGFSVVPDSPQFSALVAQHAPEHLRGTALTIYNSIGFSISAISILIFDRVFHSQGFLSKENSFLILGAGAIFGLPFITRLVKIYRSQRS